MTGSLTPAGGLPPRGELLLANGCLLTMDPDLGELPVGDVHIVDGEIAAIGTGLTAPGAERIDATGMIVLPGLVETHWHMWNTLLRGLSDGRPGATGYFQVCGALGPAFEAADCAAGVWLSCAEAISSGYTTVHDWSHNVRGPEYADAEVRVLAESGLRARFSYGWSAGHANTASMDLADLTRLHAGHEPDGLVSLGVAWRGSGGSNPAMRVDAAIYRAELALARELGLPVTVHASGPPSARGQIGVLAAEGLLGPDVQVVHANVASAEEIAALAGAGASVSVSPFTELQIGYGLPRTGEFLAAGVPTGLSVDTTVLSGNADPFAIMKLIQAVENGRAEEEFALSARRVLELATIEGARSMGLDHLVGSLTVGKRADVILVSDRAVNLGVRTDPARLLVTAAQPANVDTVLVDGRILKRAGRLTALDTAEVGSLAQAALRRVLRRADW
ncbi:MAG TPA: amidohydrolase family protein [Pseudonocardiaceae bacterium]|jgi:cytosine/adenosine deaminase-related metal-dependent hydrolase|nr:amidohydrolase family protein [Pseudonocardiaceae bacterium]